MTGAIRIAIPTTGEGGMDAERSAHFGHADSFTIVDVADGAIVAGQGITNPPHEHGGCSATVAMLAGAGVNVAIVVGMGRGPLNAMTAHGMQPLFDDVSPTPRAAVEAYLGGQTRPFGDDHTCRGH